MFLIQDGHQMHTRVDPALDAGDAGGVIWSPADHTPDALADCVSDGWPGDFINAIDPQLYVAPLADANPKKLADHGLFSVPMRPRDFAARHLVALTDRILRAQAALPVSHVLSPTVAVPSMADRWAQIAADLADTSLDVWRDLEDERPLLISVGVQSSLLADPESVDSLLDELTAYECEGFYLLFELDPSRDPIEAAALLERALYVTYTLSVVNECVVWVGYAGMNGRAFLVAGADATAGGWWQKLNWFSPSNWQAGTGGRQPRPRIYLESTIGSLLIDVELEPVSRQTIDESLFEDLLTGAGQLAADFLAGRAFDGSYERAEMTAQFIAVCAAHDSSVDADPETAMREFIADIVEAKGLHVRIRNADVAIDAATTRNLTIWESAITELANRLGFTL